ncbi:MAG: hypothetical protein J2P36_28460, partial [Ktedonobacteraceae bacterium]|nr:hypothetical protein [Ktedonobacteraceae bacterium]
VNQTAFALLETFTASLFYVAYIWLPNAISFLFNSLAENKVLDHTIHSQYESSYDQFCKSFLWWVNHKAWWMVSTVFYLLYLLNRYIVGGPPFIEHVPVWLQLVTAVLDGFIAYCVSMSIIRFLISMYFVNLLFRTFTIHVNPLHPDRSGGLGVMHRVLWVTVAIILGNTLVFYNTIQISLANNINSSALDAILLVGAYLILTPSLLMGWLALPRYLMLKARQRVLLPLMKEFQQIAMTPLSRTPEETAQILADTDRLSAIKRRYDLLDATFPTWPVEITQIRGIIAALSIPALLPLIPYVTDALQFLSKLLSSN